VTGGYNYVEVDMTLTRYSSVLLMIKNVPDAPSTNPSDWQHIDPRSTTQFDYEGMVTARIQTAHLPSPAAGSKIYIYLINFERQLTPSFSVRVNEVNNIAYRCATPVYY
jgi:hypothetical protein